MRQRTVILSLILAAGSYAFGQLQPTPQNETALGSELRLERGRFDGSCGKFSIAGCLQLAFTDHPLHISVGSIAPQNGFAAGLALVTHYDASQWYVKWDTDAVASSNGSWRAGVYIKLIPVFHRKIEVKEGQPGEVHKSKLRLMERPLFSLYAQGISLNSIDFFGLGPNTTAAGRSFYGMQQTIGGGNAIVPVPFAGQLNLSLLGEVNGRFVDLRGDRGASSPSIEALYTPVTAPGLASQPGFLQFGEGLRIAPKSEYLKADYVAKFQQFVAPGDSTFSFRRFTVDLSHEIPLYGHSKKNAAPAPDPTKIETAKINLVDPDLQKSNTPNGCGTGGKSVDCPTIASTICDTKDAQTGKCLEVRSAVSRNREGSLGARLLISESIASSGSVVPFYFQPTLGGSDIDGIRSLSSYQDYRFRAPNLLLLQETFDHSLYGPIGITLLADQGKVAVARGDIEFQHLRHSFAAGANIRAGGLPQIYVLFAWGGREGTHNIGYINTALLPGSARPSLY
jgi:hypothetical protein